MAEKKRFSDQVVWIVGASSGFGAALAHGFDQAGARLVLSARRAERLQSLAASMHQAAAVPLDLAQAKTACATRRPLPKPCLAASIAWCWPAPWPSRRRCSKSSTR